MIYGFIIAAGKQTRFKRKKPKALVDINGKSLLSINIEKMNKYCDNVYVVCSTENKDYFDGYRKIVIESGFGCGDAVLKTLDKFMLQPGDTCFIQWGDSIVDDSVYKSAIDNYKNCDVCIPCEYIKNPYVKIEYLDTNKLKVKYKKYNEIEDSSFGFHDLSIFYGDANIIKLHLSLLSYIINNKNENIKHNKELEFLDIFECNTIKCRVINQKNLSNTFSFNSIEELNNKLSKEINII